MGTFEGLSGKLGGRTEKEVTQICEILRKSIDDCVTEEQGYVPGGDYDHLVRQMHSYKGLSPRFYLHGKGPVVRDDNPQFQSMLDMDLIDLDKHPIMAPKIVGDCLPIESTDISNIFNGPYYWFLSQKAIDFYLELEGQEQIG